MNGQTLVSVVLPVCNSNKELLDAAIKSILSQSHSNIELILVDDGSDAPVSGPDDGRIVWVNHIKNRGLPAALNTGFAAATGDYLTWTSADNEYSPTAIETMLNYFQKFSFADFVCANYIMLGCAGHERLYVRGDNTATPEEPSLGSPTRICDEIRQYNAVGPCFLYKRKVYDALGEYSEHWRLVEDYEYWLRAWRKFEMIRIPEFLYFYRMSPGNLSSTHAAEIREKKKLLLADFEKRMANA